MLGTFTMKPEHTVHQNHPTLNSHIDIISLDLLERKSRSYEAWTGMF